MRFPDMYKIKQRLNAAALANPGAELEKKLKEKEELFGKLGAKRIAIAVGSRNIDALVPILKTLSSWLKRFGASPFIVPAMGSHGGGTKEGKNAILHSLGVSESSIGIPIASDLGTKFLGESAVGAEVYMERAALSSDGIVVVNRVAPHTGYSGRVQSGIQKMIAVGLGGLDGARSCHSFGFCSSDVIAKMAAFSLEKAAFLCGVALVEDGEKRL
ncbi:MAG: lactate racemase domain-containing protein, partial [Actinomycetota bacterium]|nr:lactate racemase domain-containing protein [Actinomycetota bacterium]